MRADPVSSSFSGPKLRAPTTTRWVDLVLSRFDEFLIDHAACERKAMSTGMLFVVRYPDRPSLLDPMISFAKEELDHFHEVVRHVQRRGLRLGPDVEDAYAAELLARVRTGRDERLLDRLLVSAIFEARGCERFGLLANALPPGDEKEMYRSLTRADARHQRLFLDLAGHFFRDSVIQSRLDELLDAEGEVVSRLPAGPTLYAGS